MYTKKLFLNEFFVITRGLIWIPMYLRGPMFLGGT